MRRQMLLMSLNELNAELQKMIDALGRLEDSWDESGIYQKQSALALKFALECIIRERTPAPALTDNVVVSYEQFKAKREAKRK